MAKIQGPRSKCFVFLVTNISEVLRRVPVHRKHLHLIHKVMVSIKKFRCIKLKNMFIFFKIRYYVKVFYHNFIQKHFNYTDKHFN